MALSLTWQGTHEGNEDRAAVHSGKNRGMLGVVVKAGDQ